MEKLEYNGWANYETWNVALWLENDEGLYLLARSFRHSLNPYKAFVKTLEEFGVVEGRGAINAMTPDGVKWNDSSLDLDALNALIEEG